MRQCLLQLAKKAGKPRMRLKAGEPPYYAKFGLLDGKLIKSGNKVSWSKKKTRRKWYPNIQWVKLYSETLDRQIPFMVTTSVLKKIDYKGGIDAYLLKTPEAQLKASEVAMEWRRRIQNQKNINDTKDEIERQAQLLAAHLLSLHQQNKEVLLTQGTTYGHYINPAVLNNPALRRKLEHFAGKASLVPGPDLTKRVLLVQPAAKLRRRRKAKAKANANAQAALRVVKKGDVSGTQEKESLPEAVAKSTS
uniref:Large ribosomal subunit protein bL28m n=1 Tax=Eutreptiella gymnastica TaxID=73025 RepID=A0A7S1NJP0_9EUGL|mmetsp:Transcript_48937/g.87241  ORF Transcript_48937/g.87241 Transcript_48937/m.87241 type:complete len:249 (+) Transcript_48937:75-821(+)